MVNSESLFIPTNWATTTDEEIVNLVIKNQEYVDYLFAIKNSLFDQSN